MRSIVVVCSQHHGNTEKVARVLAKVLGAEVKRPQDVDPHDLHDCDLVGFGSGIDSDNHYTALLDCADELPRTSGKRVFIFSTCGVPVVVAGQDLIEEYSARSHSALREKLHSRGYAVIGEFCCAGHNTNGFLRFIGGLNKGRPNAEDLGRAENFAKALAARIQEKRES
jgi:flavodoxin